MSGVVLAADSTINFVSEESLRLLLGALIPGLIKAAPYFLKRIFSLQPPGRDDRAKQRAETLLQIMEVRRKELTPTSDNVIKALYEKIKMYYPIRINDYILEFSREDGVQYEDRELKAFTSITPLPDVINETLKTYNERYRKVRKGYFFSFVFSVAMFFIPMYIVLELGKASHGEAKVVAAFVLFSLYAVWGVLAWFIINDFDRQRMARCFFKRFEPWLKNKINEDKLAEKLTCPDDVNNSSNMSERQSNNKSVSTSFKLWLINKWKT